MKANRLLPLIFAVALWATAPFTYATPIYSASFQGLTFTFNQTSSNALSFDIAGTPSGDWSTAQYLIGFDLKDLGLCFGNCSAGVTQSYGTANGPGATDLAGLNSQMSGSNADCATVTNGESGTICFTPNVALGALPMDLKYDIVFTDSSGNATPLNIASIGPHLQIAFAADSYDLSIGKKVGSLYSQNVGVPAPGTVTLFGVGLLGLGLMGFMRRNRLSQ